MTRILQVTMPDGSVWAIPAELVAEPRAAYYAGHDARHSGANYDTVYARELRTGADNLIDWAQNSMNWEDVQDSATMVSGPPAVDYQEGWVNGEMRIVDR